MIGMLSETDFMENNAQSRPAQVGWRNFPPMWSVPVSIYRSYNENITFGLRVDHLDNGNYEFHACQSTSPNVVCFKASIVLQGLAVIAPRQLQPSSDVEGERRKRTYCPTTYEGATSYYSPGQYSDQLADAGVPAILAHKCTIPFICNMSNKHQKHPTSACADAPSTIPIGLITPLSSTTSPDFDSKEHMAEFINNLLKPAPLFPEMPPVNEDNEIYVYKTGRKMPPKTDCEETSPALLRSSARRMKNSGQNKSKREENGTKTIRRRISGHGPLVEPLHKVEIGKEVRSEEPVRHQAKIRLRRAQLQKILSLAPTG